jgi:signal transduction histidine kinase
MGASHVGRRTLETKAVEKAGLETLLDSRELAELRPMLARNARITKALFRAAHANVVLFKGGQLWRASHNGVAKAETDPASVLVAGSGEAVWVSDLAVDPRFSRHPTVRRAKGLRSYAGAPIRLASGEVIGALAVYGDRPTPFNAELADRLQDLAEGVATECNMILARREREDLLAQMRSTEERLHFAVESAGLYVYEMDYVNQTLDKTGVEQDFYGSARDYAQVRDGLTAVIHPDDLHVIAESWAVARETGGQQRAEWRVNRPDKLVWVESTARVFTDEAGVVTRRLGTVRNITERKLGEIEMAEAKAAAESANVAKSAFLATMSHEIRTPLNGVLGMAQAMATDEMSDIQRDRLDVIRQSGESLLAILNDILDLSKIEAGKLEMEMVEFDLAEIARGAHATFTALANKKGLSFALDIEKGRGVYLGDPTRVRQVLYNLISNALKFTEQGEIRVIARFERKKLVISVTDTGIGMSKAVCDSLFQKFNQADASTTRRFGGTGLGLAICKQLAELMDGKIVVTSKEGQGSTFTFSVPLKRVGNAKVVTLTEPVVEAKEETQALEIRVLAAEDNSVNQLVLKTLLHQIGVDPVMVDNGALCVEAWEKQPWDVILMDVQMPVMDGPTATRTIRERELAQGRPRTPIVALTANAMSHQIAEYLACGMDGHVTKPIEAMKLFAALEAALDLGEAAREEAA